MSRLFKTIPPYEPLKGVPMSPGIWLSDMISRASEQGVKPDMLSPDSYDDDESDPTDVDPNFNIKTDRFALAESMSREHARIAANMINESSSASVGAAASAQSLSQPNEVSPNGDTASAPPAPTE